jgi:hypothetical protein
MNFTHILELFFPSKNETFWILGISPTGGIIFWGDFSPTPKPDPKKVGVSVGFPIG